MRSARLRATSPGTNPAWLGRLGASASLALVLALPVAGRSASLAETIKRVKPAVVGVGTHQAIRRPPDLLLGTGFAVGNGSYIVTNYHVVRNHQTALGKEHLVVFLGEGENPDLRRAELVSSDAEHDTALLRFEGSPISPLTLAAGGSAEEGQAIAFTGYPIGAIYGLRPVTHRGIVSAVTPIAIPQYSSHVLDGSLLQRLRDRFVVYQLDATAYPGNSGSPLYDVGTGEVIGILSSSFVKQSREKLLSDPSAISFAIPISYAVELMRAADAASEP